jgi:hypothetical protein
MIKDASFASDSYEDRWPRPEEIQHFFLAPPGKRWFFDGNDVAYFTINGVDGTDHLAPDDQRRANISLWLVGDPKLGVHLQWRKWDGKEPRVFYSKGDLTRLREQIENLHGDPSPAGLFVPYEAAWKAVKEFIENDGARSNSIEWIASEDLPPKTFVDPLDA